MVEKASNIHFETKRGYKKVASRQVEFLFDRDFGQQRGFGSLAQVFGRIAKPFWPKYVLPAAKRVDADLLEFAMPEIGDSASGRKNFNTAAKVFGRRAPKKNCWVVVAA